MACSSLERDYSGCSQCMVQKPASMMLWFCIGACEIGNLHICLDMTDETPSFGKCETKFLFM